MYSADGATKVGKVSKQWTGFVREAFTDADNFGINFPIDLDVKMKAVLLGACFLIVSSLTIPCLFVCFYFPDSHFEFFIAGLYVLRESEQQRARQSGNVLKPSASTRWPPTLIPV